MDATNRRKARGDPAFLQRCDRRGEIPAPQRLDQPVLAGTVDRGPATGRLQLDEDEPGVGADGVVGDEEDPGDLGCGQLAAEEAQHLELPLAERVEERLADERLARCRIIRLGQERVG